MPRADVEAVGVGTAVRDRPTVIAVEALAIDGTRGSKLNFPAMPHMSGRRQSAAARAATHAAAGELGQVEPSKPATIRSNE